MKKILLFGLGTVFAMSMVACTVGETDEGELNVVSNFENLPLCSSQKNMVGTSYIHQKFYVEEEDAYYLCDESGWSISDGTPMDYSEDTIAVVERNAVIGSAFAGGFFEQGSPVVLREVKLDADKNELKATGITFKDDISSSAGDFVISNVSLFANYALVEVTGLYYDMNTGRLSEDSVKLGTLVDLEDIDEIKVNLFSEMELPRIKKLVKNGYSVRAAKIQAEHELLSALGFGGSVENLDAAMLATGIIFRNTGDVSDLMSAIKAFGEAFSEYGVWNDKKSKTAFADFAYALENLKVRDEDNGDVIMRNETFRRNLEFFGMPEIPGFESYVTKFWNSDYGLGACGAARENVVMKNQNESSDSASAYFICKGFGWVPATDFERDTVGLGAALDGTIMEGNVDNENLYVYDTAGLGSGRPNRWLPIETAMLDEGREDKLMADSLILDKWIGYACTDFEDARYTMAMTVNDVDSTYWGCDKRKWAAYDAFVYKVGSLCHADIYDFNKVETVKVGGVTRYLHCDSIVSDDKKDTIWTWVQTLSKFDASYGICDDEHVDNIGKVVTYKDGGVDSYARCVYSGSGKDFSWVEGFTETDYNTRNQETCLPKKVANIGTNSYVCTEAVKMGKDTLYFNWREASKAEAKAGKPCTAEALGETVTVKMVKYQCAQTYVDYVTDPMNPQSVLLVDSNDVNFNEYLPVSWYSTEDNVTELQ